MSINVYICVNKYICIFAYIHIYIFAKRCAVQNRERGQSVLGPKLRPSGWKKETATNLGNLLLLVQELDNRISAPHVLDSETGVPRRTLALNERRYLYRTRFDLKLNNVCGRVAEPEPIGTVFIWVSDTRTGNEAKLKKI
jgi:hypothetical protein